MCCAAHGGKHSIALDIASEQPQALLKWKAARDAVEISTSSSHHRSDARQLYASDSLNSMTPAGKQRPSAPLSHPRLQLVFSLFAAQQIALAVCMYAAASSSAFKLLH